LTLKWQWLLEPPLSGSGSDENASERGHGDGEEDELGSVTEVFWGRKGDGVVRIMASPIAKLARQPPVKVALKCCIIICNVGSNSS
jgi:hypothetical protein